MQVKVKNEIQNDAQKPITKPIISHAYLAKTFYRC